MSADAARRERFEAVAAEVWEPLQRYLARRAGGADAADVFGETMLTVWRRLDDVPVDQPLPWCYGVARRALANHRRGRGRHLHLVDRVGAASTELYRHGAGDPQERVDQADPELDAAIATLSDAEAEIVRLWAWERLEPREIADALDLTPNAVSVALSRAKRKLADRLQPVTHGTPPGISGEPRQDRATAGQEGDVGPVEPGRSER